LTKSGDSERQTRVQDMPGIRSFLKPLGSPLIKTGHNGKKFIMMRKTWMVDPGGVAYASDRRPF